MMEPQKFLKYFVAITNFWIGKRRKSLALRFNHTLVKVIGKRRVSVFHKRLVLHPLIVLQVVVGPGVLVPPV